MRSVGGGDGSVITMPPHGEITQNYPATEPGGKCWKREARYICGVLSTGTELGDVSGRMVTSEGEQPEEAQRTLHVSVLEVKGEDPTGGNRSTAR